jgi:hypothetical protein
MSTNAKILSNIQVELKLRKRGRGVYGQYSLSKLSRCPVVYKAPNELLAYTTSCSAITGPGSFRYRWLLGPSAPQSWSSVTLN